MENRVRNLIAVMCLCLAWTSDARAQDVGTLGFSDISAFAEEEALRPIPDPSTAAAAAAMGMERFPEEEALSVVEAVEDALPVRISLRLPPGRDVDAFFAALRHDPARPVFLERVGGFSVAGFVMPEGAGGRCLVERREAWGQVAWLAEIGWSPWGSAAVTGDAVLLSWDGEGNRRFTLGFRPGGARSLPGAVSGGVATIPVPQGLRAAFRRADAMEVSAGGVSRVVSLASSNAASDRVDACLRDVAGKAGMISAALAGPG